MFRKNQFSICNLQFAICNSPLSSRLRLCLSLFLCIASASLAAEERSVTVVATGELTVRPDSLEMDLRSAGAAELTSDAIVKYHDRLRRVCEAFGKLDIKNLRLEPRDLSVGDSADQQHPKPQLTIAKTFRVTVSQLHDMTEMELLTIIGKLIDTAKDVGTEADESQQGMLQVRFAVQEPRRLRAKACHQAFERAKEEAEQLAELAGGRLGRAVAVEDLSEANGNAVLETISAIYGGNAEPQEQGRLVANSLGEVSVRVALRVRFELKNDQEAVAEK